MGKIRRKYDAEFKKSIAEQIVSGQKSMNSLCREHQMSPGTVSLWVKKYEQGQSFKSGPSCKEKLLERENLKLKEKLAELYLQVDALKKMEDFLQQKRRENSYVITSRSLVPSGGGVK